jgi:hypothetical protein
MSYSLATKKVFLLVFFSLSFLGGCTTPSTPDFLEMTKKYASVIEQYQIDMIFANIIRSALDRPLSFLDIPNITGTGSVTNTASLFANFAGTGAFVADRLQGSLATVTPSWSLQFGNSFNFSQASLDNAVFWKAFLTPISAESAKYFIFNHMPKEVVFSLMIDEIIISYPNGKRKFFINNPQRPEHLEFQKELYQLLSYGLGVHSTYDYTNAGDPMSEEQLIKDYGANPRQVLAKSGYELRLTEIGPAAQYQIVKLTPVYKLCIRPGEFNNVVKEKYGSNLICQDSAIAEATMSDKSRESKLIMVLRSPKSVYDYLGQVVNAQLADPPYLVTLPPTSEFTYIKNPKESNKFALFVINRNKPNEKTFSRIDAGDDNTYSIGRENIGYSTLVINLLAQFQVLAKSPGSIPSSPAVLIR